MALWRKPYTLRRYGQSKMVRGYTTSEYTDTVVQLDVQPLSTTELEALPEGERSKKRVTTYGSYAIQIADQATQTKGDRLYYEGSWYEAETSEMWMGTPIGHYCCQFVKVAETEQTNPPMEGGE